MDQPVVVAFPSPATLDDAEATSRGVAALREIDAAIELVLSGVARRLRLTAIPFIETVAATGLAHAGAAGVDFRLERRDRLGVATVTIGPVRPESTR